MNFSDYKKTLIQNYPSTASFLDEKGWEFPLFPESVSLSSEAFKSMESVIKVLFFLKQDQKYIESVFEGNSNLMSHQSHPQDSVLMAYDFHIDQNGKPRLIEVNTNASGFLLVNSFYQFRKGNYQLSLESLKSSFEQEWKAYSSLQDHQDLKPKKIVLIDDNVLEQKMYIEFLMYKDFFKSMGWFLDICESSSLKVNDENVLVNSQGEKVDFIYNRCTDFYFKKHAQLLKAYQSNMCCISPHPREYALLSDKKRLSSWVLDMEKWPLLKTIKKNLIASYILSKDRDEEVWKNKKKYFFKPLRSHGGKMAYRGSSLTRKKFELLCESSSLFQEYVPPSVWTDSKGEEWKLDFRAFVYKDQIQQLVARCYKGQITNFKESGSGWALVQVG